MSNYNLSTKQYVQALKDLGLSAEEIDRIVESSIEINSASRKRLQVKLMRTALAGRDKTKKHVDEIIKASLSPKKAAVTPEHETAD